MPADQELNLTLDARKIAHEHFTVRVQVKNSLIVRVGVFIIRIGCWISGAQFVEEFPMSLIQKDDNDG